MEIIDQMNRERVLYLFLCSLSSSGLCLRLCFSGGILGWDPVHTTCIFVRGVIKYDGNIVYLV